MSATKKTTYSDLEQTLESSQFSIGQERNDFLLPQIIDLVRKDQWINTRPEYQRRLVWDLTKKSRLIESLFMNVPVPPIFLYEHDLNRYEVMDGQQRLNTIIDFYLNKFSLRGLEYWSALNGFKYSDLPSRAQRGLDRRRITATVLIADQSQTAEQISELRKQVFDRLNTGGQKLVAQELRNCLYSGPFNELIIELAGLPKFNDMWGIPRYRDNIRNDNVTDRLATNTLYKRMTDVEIVLRYFAFRKTKSSIRGAVKRILDQVMIENVSAPPSLIEEMRADFIRDLSLVNDVFGDDGFRLPVEGAASALGTHSQPYYDALMVSAFRTSDRHAQLRKSAGKLRTAVRQAVLKNEETKDLFVGRANTAKAIRERLDRMEKSFLLVCR